MKKILLAFTTVLLAGFLFTSANPSLDGRALVADEGVFPHGYFAKTVGYLPGDSIKVTNPTNGERVDILVIGSLDASDGVAVLLSPEAAQALSIKKNSNTLVKLTKRNGNADDVVSGSAVLAMDDTEPEPEETYPEVAMPQPIEEEVAEPAEEYAENAIIPEEQDLSVDYAMDIPEEEAEEEEELAKIEEDIPEEYAAAEKVEEEIPEEYAKEEVETPKPEYVIADDIPEDEEVAEVAKNNPIDEDYLVDEFPEDEYVAVEDIPEEEAAPELAEVPEIPTEEELAAAQEFISDEESETDEYDAIVLVPSEENPPESNEEIAEATPAPKVDVSSVADYSELDSGKYYVQIAVYNQVENIEEVNDLYGSRYPLVVLDKGDRKTVMVGPFNVDEYGTVLERFKAYGYTDAFVKKIN